MSLVTKHDEDWNNQFQSFWYKDIEFFVTDIKQLKYYDINDHLAILPCSRGIFTLNRKSKEKAIMWVIDNYEGF